jgi:hypothetical protein
MNYPRNHEDPDISPVRGCEDNLEAAAFREIVSSVGTMRNSVPKLQRAVLHISGSQREMDRTVEKNSKTQRYDE